jgi:hypothetical protein
MMFERFLWHNIEYLALGCVKYGLYAIINLDIGIAD